jgi:hypothetical protein
MFARTSSATHLASIPVLFIFRLQIWLSRLLFRSLRRMRVFWPIATLDRELVPPRKS